MGCCGRGKSRLAGILVAVIADHLVVAADVSAVAASASLWQGWREF